MKIVAYLYSDLWLDDLPSPDFWGWEVDQVYHDIRDRPHPDLTARSQLQQLLQDSAIAAPDYVLIRRLEDLGEDVQAVSDRLSTLEQRGCQIIAIEQDYHSGRFTPPVDSLAPPTSESAATLRRDLIHLLAEVQRQQQNRRIQRGHAANRRQALPPPGKAPYGYRRGKERYAIDRSTAPVVKDFFEQFLLYGSVRGAVRYLAKRYGKKISPTTGRHWLTSAVYRGDLAYGDGTTIRDTHPPIISRNEAAQVDRLLRRNQSLPPRTASSPRSLSGLVRCATCQSAMTVTHVTQRSGRPDYLYLRPTACPQTPKCRSLRYEQVLDATIQAICRELPPAVANLTLPDMARLKMAIAAQIEAKNQILTQLPDLIQSGILDPASAELRAYTLKSDIAHLYGQLDQLPPVNLQATAQTVSIPQFWFDLTEAERRFYFREFIQHIELIRQPDSWTVAIAFVF